MQEKITQISIQKTCLCCGIGYTEIIESTDFPGHYTFLCSNKDCFFSAEMQEPIKDGDFK